MPPKETGSAKKGKLSKADKERLKKEEEERKIQEAEEAQLKAVAEEKARKAQAKIEAIERKKLENEEKKLRKVQMAELETYLEADREALKMIADEKRREAKWSRFMRCDGSPDPINQWEINTYINLRLEDNTRNDIKHVLKDSKLTLSLIKELEDVLNDDGAAKTPSEIALYKETIPDMQSLIMVKLDAASHEVLLKASALQNAETSNLQFFTKDGNVSLCLWGNLSKNPRTKNFEFAEIGFTFDIPKFLALSECAYRVMVTKFDHFSEYCKTYNPRPKIKPEPVEEVTVEIEAEQKTEVKEESGEEKAEESEVKKEDTMDIMSALNNASSEHGDGTEQEEEEEKEEKVDEVEDYEDPDSPEPLEWEENEDEDDVIDLRANHVIGGVFHFNLLHLPPQPKLIKGWTMTKMVLPPELQIMPYQPDAAQTAAVQNKEPKEGETKEVKKEERPAIAVTMKLPEDVLFLEEPQIARWDYSLKHWRMDGFSDISFNEEARQVQFKTLVFGTMALLEDKHINMPFQSWEIRPRTPTSAVFTIIAAILEIEMEIKDDVCCLTRPNDKPEIQHILHKWVKPQELITMMQRAGVNIFPSVDSAKYVSIQQKSPIVESRLYEQMALTLPTMAYSWSKWNSDAGRDSLVLQGSESLKDEPLLEEEWAVYMVTKRRSMKLKMSEFDSDYSEDMAEGSELRADMYHLVMLQGSQEAQERVQNRDFHFVNCVEQLLKATQILTYA